jgi:hypothetical protein
VQAGKRELTLDVYEYSRDQIDRIVATARERGLHAAVGTHSVLLRALRGMDQGIHPPVAEARASERSARRQPAHKRQTRLDTGAESFALTVQERAPTRERRAVHRPVSDTQASFDIDTRPRFSRKR